MIGMTRMTGVTGLTDYHWGEQDDYDGYSD